MLQDINVCRPGWDGCKIDVRMKLTVLISRQGVALLTVLADIETVTTET